MTWVDASGGFEVRGVIDALVGLGAGAPRVSLREETAAGPPARATHEPLPQPSVGKRSYELLGEIASGPQSVVYKARDTDLGREVAMKMLRADLAGDPRAVERFVFEAQIAAQLQHPGIVPVHDMGLTADGRPFFTMKVVRGRSLESLFGRKSAIKLDRRQWMTNFEQLAQALAYTHARGVVHGNLTPANVLVGAFGQIQLLDWGSARLVRAGRAAGDTGDDRRVPSSPNMAPLEVDGDPAFLPPERLLGDLERIDERADVYSLGALLCTFLTGEPPYSGDRRDVLTAAAQGRLDAAMRRLDRCDAPGELVELAKACLAPAPGNRPESAVAVAKAFAERCTAIDARRDEASLAAEQDSRKAEREFRRARTRRVLAETVMLGVLGVTGFYLVHVRGVEQRREAAEARLHEEVECLQFLWSQARSAPDYDDEIWSETVAAGSRASGLLASADVDETTRQRVEYILMTMRWERDAAQKADRHARQGAQLVHELAEVRMPEGEEPAARVAGAIAKIFNRHELDPLELGAEEAGRRIAQTAVPHALAGALDAWGIALHGQRDAWTEEASAPLRAAIAADPDPDRVQLREAILADDAQGIEAFRSAAGDDLAAPTALLLARALTFTGRPDRAVAVLSAVEREHPDDFDVHVELARDLERLQPPGLHRAARHYGIALALRPDSVEVRHRLAHALEAAGEPGTALDVLVAARERRPDDPHLQRLFGDVQARLGDEAGAIETWRKAVELAPGDSEAYIALGTQLGERGDAQGAREALERAVEMAPDDASAHYHLGTWIAANDPSDPAAQRAFERATELRPEWIEPWRALCDLHADAGRLDETVDTAMLALQVDPSDPALHVLLGRALARRGEIPAATLALRESLIIAPDDEQVAAELADMLIVRMHDPRGAVAMFADLAELSPESLVLQRHLAAAQRERGDLPAAAATLEHALTLAPTDARLHADLGWARLEGGQVAAAEQAFERARELDAQDADAALGLGRARAADGDAAGAIRAYRESIALRGERAETHYRLAVALQREGDLRAAREAYDRALELDPSHAEAHCNLAALLSHEGRYDEALVEYRRGHELGSARVGWTHPSAEWVAEAERLAGLQERLDEVAAGTSTVRVDEDALAMAQMASRRHMNDTSARLFQTAFEREPGSVPQSRYQAACAAAQAASGQGVDALELDPGARARWRRAALQWLSEELEASRSRVRSGALKPAELAERLEVWRRSPELAGVRDDAFLVGLGTEDVEACRGVWRAVVAEQARLRGDER